MASSEKRKQTQADYSPKKQKKNSGYVGARIHVKVDSTHAHKGRSGEVLQHDPSDKDNLCFKIRFSDDSDEDHTQKEDWLAPNDIEIQPSFLRLEQLRADTKRELEGVEQAFQKDLDEYRDRLKQHAVTNAVGAAASVLPVLHFAAAAKKCTLVTETSRAFKEVAEIAKLLGSCKDFHVASTALPEIEEKLLHLCARPTKIPLEDKLKKLVGNDNFKYTDEGEPGVRVLQTFTRMKCLHERLKTLDMLFRPETC